MPSLRQSLAVAKYGSIKEHGRGVVPRRAAAGGGAWGGSEGYLFPLFSWLVRSKWSLLAMLILFSVGIIAAQFDLFVAYFKERAALSSSSATSTSSSSGETFSRTLLLGVVNASSSSERAKTSSHSSASSTSASLASLPGSTFGSEKSTSGKDESSTEAEEAGVETEEAGVETEDAGAEAEPKEESFVEERAARDEAQQEAEASGEAEGEGGDGSSNSSGSRDGGSDGGGSSSREQKDAAGEGQAAAAAAAAATTEGDEQVATAARKGDAHVADGEEGAAVLFRGAPWKAAVGRWLKKCGGFSALVEIEEKSHRLSCPDGCSGHGDCNAETGSCRCRHGYKGPSCNEDDEYPCNLPANDLSPYGPWVVSQCSAFCDKRIGRCMCGPDSPNPDRSVVEPCGFARTSEGHPDRTKVDHDSLYSSADATSPGWCQLDASAVEATRQVVRAENRNCFCNYDDRGGEVCSTPILSFCTNQCWGRGYCERGFCKCHSGWFGLDCSLPSSSAPASKIRSLPSWLRDALHDADEPAVHDADRFNESGHELGRGVKRRRGDGTSLRQLSGEQTASFDADRRIKRRRPLIYVYDLPPEFTFHHLEGRKWHRYCAPWLHNERNESEFNTGWLYGSEMALIGSLLSSPHRTTNPDEADFFFVPVFGACIIARADDSPRFQMAGKYLSKRPNLVADLYLQALDFIKSNFPFWNASGGRDHIWAFVWDEGACYAPQALWPSILLSHFGNRNSKHTRSTTAYPWDSWDFIPHDVRGDHPCFDPSKDVIMPAWKAPTSWVPGGGRWARPVEERPLLFYFNGNLGFEYGGRPEKEYSMGIRQLVARYFGSTPNKEGVLGSASEEGVVVTNQPGAEYGEGLASSKFCGVFPGDGFSARMEDSILHGCIPVIVQDGIDMTYENFLVFDKFAVRIREDDIPRMIQILKEIPIERVKAMQEVVASIWSRWYYRSYVGHVYEFQQNLGHTPYWGQENESLEGDDAISTLVQILHYKLHNDDWRKGFRRDRDFGIDKTCLPR